MSTTPAGTVDSPRTQAPVHLTEEDRSVTEMLLSTTRAVRLRLDLDSPVPADALRRAIELARQAPSAGGASLLAWVVVQEREVIQEIGVHYRTAFAELDEERGFNEGTDARTQRIRRSSRHLAESFGRLPAVIAVCATISPPQTSVLADQAKYWASVYPAVWSLQLALRAQGLGSSITTVGLRRHDEIRKSLQVPQDWTVTALVPVARMTGETLRSTAPRGEEPRWI